MISKYDIIKGLKDAEKNQTDTIVILSEDEKSVLDSRTKEYICSIDTFLEYIRIKEHCDFESIYYDHATLTDIYRCRQCRTVIFGGDDERYDPNCRCPTCCHDDSVCHNEYWTKEQIDADPEKQKTIDVLIEEQARKNRAYERRKSRNGLYDWERWQKEFKTKKRGYKITHICYGYDGDTGKVIGHAHRYIEIVSYRLNDGIRNKIVKIPISWYAFYIFYIFPHTKKYKKSLT